MNTTSFKAVLILCLAFAAALAGCSGPASHVTGTPETANVSLLMTDAAPANVGLFSFEVTITSAILNPGNVQLLSAPVTVEVTRLQTETALIASGSVPPGTYTSITLTYSTPEITFQNDTGSSMTVGSTVCANGQTCTASPTAVTTTGAVTLGSSLTAVANTSGALLLDLNLATALSNTLSVDLIGGSTVTSVTPAISGGPFANLESVVGIVTAVNSVAQTFSLQTHFGTYVVSTATTSPATVYSNFPGSVSCTSDFACLAVGQIVAVNMNFQSVQTNGTFIASDVFFEDASFSVPEIEGIVVTTTGVTAPGQFRIVVLEESSTVSGIPIGQLIDVEPNPSPAATYTIDNFGADTSGFTFAALGDVIVGQEVSLQELPASTGSLIVAGRIQLESSRITARLSNTFLPNFAINGLPAYFGSLSQIQVNTGAYTEFGGTAISDTQLIVGHTVSVRGQLFANGLTPVAVATKVIQH